MGLTDKAENILKAYNLEVQITDSFGNTALHLLAARLPLGPSLLEAVTRSSDDVLSALNTAHQTFLHVLDLQRIQNAGTEGSPLASLLAHLRIRKFPIYIRDIYGRSFFHILQTNVQDQEVLKLIFSFYDHGQIARRDAFGVLPTDDGNNHSIHPLLSHERSCDTLVHKYSEILKEIRLASVNPLLEDHLGRNGLHLIDDAILSVDTVDKDLGSHGDGQTTGKPQDISIERLLFRQTLVIWLLEAGVDVNHYNKDGNTVLMAFVARLPEDDDYKTPCDIIRQLIDAGANINARNKSGETALHIAVRAGRKLAAKTLVEAGANVHVRDGEGRSVLEVADVKILNARDVKKYTHYEAIRGRLSGIQGQAIQNPTVKNEWGKEPTQIKAQG
ncbi:hypothetical protein IL306_009417 [Fusarium sp. DS 682]|nr:hypothetical protein IL306_009417 [Fusarium sp. DS 682]